MELIKREKGKIYINEDKALLKTKLNEYPYLLDNYDIRFMKYDLFIEIVHDKKVVGFLALKRVYENNLSLTDVYILPEFRNKHLMIKQILKILMSRIDLTICEPNRNFVEILIHYKLAEKLNDNLVASSLSFDITDNHALYSSDFKSEEEISTFLYDLNLCSPIFMEDILSDGKCDIIYQKALKEDEKYCRNIRNSDLDDYFNEFKKFFKKNAYEFADVLKRLMDNLPQNETPKTDKIKELVEKEVEKGRISKENREKFENTLKEEFENENVLEENLDKFLNYLIRDESWDESGKIPQKSCPNCYHEVTSHDKTCNNCGWNISDGNYLTKEEFIDEFLRDNFEEMMESVFSENDENRNLKDKLKVDIEESQYESISIPNTDLKYLKHTFYGSKNKYFLNENLEFDENLKTTKELHIVLGELLENSNIYEIISEHNIEKTVIGDLINSFLIRSKNHSYPIPEVIDEKHSLDKLNEILKKNEIEKQDTKDEAIHKIIENGLVGETGISDFVVTPPGELAYDQTSWIDFLNDNLDIFDLNDFSNFTENYKNTPFEQQCEQYLSEHLKIAFTKKDHKKIHDTIASKSLSNTMFKNPSAALNDEIQLFIVNLNPVYLDDLEDYNFISKSNISNIASLSQAANKKNLKKVFNKNWDKLDFDKIVIGKKTALKYLTDAVNGKNIEDIEKNIKKEYFK